eukprot:CAMPEP_0170615168 /NCGR_PEP_ID=MMETSP0224-20130122/25191_1 /TAXON_ID=285029 /ORGANISM="Togula jolla, Strain CCCM 725" /LENGTH=72 /DNA_ID=CAMNT_0010940877 /DNA_START=78 /DNA_END=296 /DNA_ORIENTATION=+
MTQPLASESDTPHRLPASSPLLVLAFLGEVMLWHQRFHVTVLKLHRVHRSQLRTISCNHRAGDEHTLDAPLL